MKTTFHETTLVVVKKGDKYLLIKRANEPGKGLWAFAGGHVDEGETITQCAQREAEEEVGEVKVDKEPFCIFTHDVLEGEKLANFKKHKHRLHAFFAEPVGKIKASSDAAEAKWFTLEEAKKLKLTEYSKKVLKKVEEINQS